MEPECADQQGWGCGRTCSPTPGQGHSLYHSPTLGVFKPPGIKVKASFTITGLQPLNSVFRDNCPIYSSKLRDQGKVDEIKDFIFHLFSVINERGFPLIQSQRVSTRMILAGLQYVSTTPST
uniref:Uncharacterized protein n=1 Tax=Pipistrellus kuhlii TaxID=59472 RepID=A0A7J7YWP7_PIPKU|nr:hypothetical protein mPipKuh1_009850 [Pipistrellus kuhlii]